MILTRPLIIDEASEEADATPCNWLSYPTYTGAGLPMAKSVYQRASFKAQCQT